MIEALMYSNKYQTELKEHMAKHSYLCEKYQEITTDPLRLSIFGAVRKIREQRMQMVKKECQYMFIYSYMERWMERNKDWIQSLRDAQ